MILVHLHNRMYTIYQTRWNVSAQIKDFTPQQNRMFLSSINLSSPLTRPLTPAKKAGHKRMRLACCVACSGADRDCSCMSDSVTNLETLHRGYPFSSVSLYDNTNTLHSCKWMSAPACVSVPVGAICCGKDLCARSGHLHAGSAKCQVMVVELWCITSCFCITVFCLCSAVLDNPVMFLNHLNMFLCRWCSYRDVCKSKSVQSQNLYLLHLRPLK